MRLDATGPLSNSEHVRRARFAATPTASPQGPAPITARSSINETLSRHFDDLIAMAADAHVLDGRVRQVLEPVQIGAGRRWQIRQPAHLAEGFLPAGERFVQRLHAGETLHFGGHRVERLAVAAVPHAYGNLRERVEHVELGDREAGEAVDAYRIAHHDGVEPAAATRPTCGRPVLVSQLANALGQRRRSLGGKRPIAHTGRVRLDDPEYRIDRRGADSRPDRRAAG